MEFITGYTTMVWQECIFALKTNEDSEATYCGSFSYLITSESGVD